MVEILLSTNFKVLEMHTRRPTLKYYSNVKISVFKCYVVLRMSKIHSHPLSFQTIYFTKEFRKLTENSTYHTTSSGFHTIRISKHMNSRTRLHNLICQLTQPYASLNELLLRSIQNDTNDRNYSNESSVLKILSGMCIFGDVFFLSVR